MAIFDTFWPKNPQFRFFPRVPLLLHASRHLGEDFGSFQPKLKTKIEVISQIPSKNWIFGKIGHFLTVFGQKWPIFDFFSKIRLEHFFTLPKPYLNAKYQKKLM